MMRYYLTIGFILSLTSCVTSDLEVNQYVNASKHGNAPNVFKSSSSTVRSYAVNSEGKKVEVSGAQCSARNRLVGFNVKTPAVVTLPTFLQGDRFHERGKPPLIRGKCRYNGKTVVFTIEPSSAVDHTTEFGTGTYNPSTGTYINPTVTRLTGRLSSTLPWAYPSVKVNF